MHSSKEFKWSELNIILRNTTDEKECLNLLKKEKKFGRKAYILRIHSRYNRLRYLREREELANSFK